jgi:hypothetical protein
MKKVSAFALGIAAIGFVAFNVTVSQQKKATTGSLSNIKTLQASAGEFNCDKSNSNSCTIDGKAYTGVLTYIN